MFKHILVFEHWKTSEAAKRIVPSRIRGFIEGQSYIGFDDASPRYRFYTEERISPSDIKYIVKLTCAQKMLIVNSSFL